MTAVGSVVRFKRASHRVHYGDTATVTHAQVAVSRPFGTRTTLYDLTTANGTHLQWPASWLNRDTKGDGK